MRWLSLFLWVMFWSSSVRAQPASEPFIVEVTAAGETSPVAALEQRTRTLLVNYPVVVAWSVATNFRAHDVFDAGSSTPALARIWLDARTPSRAVIYLVDDAHDRFLVRVVPLDAGYDEVACESIGTIVQSSVEALLAGASVGVNRETAEAQVAAIEPEQPEPDPSPAPLPPAPAPPPRVEPTSVPPRATPNVLLLGIDVGYRAGLLRDTPVLRHGPEVGVTLAQDASGISAAGGLHVGYRVPSSWEVDGIGAEFEGAGARIAGGLRSKLSATFSVSALATFGAELLRVTPEVSDDDQRARAAFRVVQPMLGAALESELMLSPHLAMWLTLGAEGDLLGHRFDVAKNGEASPLLDPWLVQPMIRIGARMLPRAAQR